MGPEDIEQASHQPDGPESTLDGFPRLAWFMGHHPDHFVVRRFSTLNAQMVLYLQSELYTLEEKLRAQEAKDSALRKEDPQRPDLLNHFHYLGGFLQDERAAPQWDLVVEIREKLALYSQYAPRAK